MTDMDKAAEFIADLTQKLTDSQLTQLVLVNVCLIKELRRAGALDDAALARLIGEAGDAADRLSPKFGGGDMRRVIRQFQYYLGLPQPPVQ